MTGEIIRITTYEQIENLSKKYGENAMFKSVHEPDYEISIPDIRFYADNQDEFDYELVLA